MALEALYFPTIRVPDNRWFRHALLYWDCVWAIVPEELQRPKHVGWRMDNYVGFGLVRLIAPDDYVANRLDFANEFLEDLTTSPDLNDLKESFSRANAAGWPADQVRRLHVQKADGHLLYELEQSGVAVHAEGPESASWYYVQPIVASRYMAALARLMSGSDFELPTNYGDAPKPQLDPVTDSKPDLEALLDVERSTIDAGEAAFNQERAALRTTILNLALPSIQGPLSAAEIKRFKQQHGSMLRQFRVFVEREATRIAGLEKPYMRKQETKALMDELDGELDEIESRLSETEWTVNRRASLWKVGTTVAQTAGDAVLSGPTSLVKNAPEAAQTIRGVFKRRESPDGVGPLAYAIAARKRFAPAKAAT